MKNVVVIYAENRSFNNLFANFPGVEKAMAARWSFRASGYSGFDIYQMPMEPWALV
ncbi:alkaline phosphatase family protein [Serratia quinivorans]|uniref:alkaline phosphatase family protein n=1 Tax=Serratia quinivorans TaxID=137545 RepID=UPI0028DCBD0E|nr:alkaline phosphatase family protein [Serratia quinivorans]